MGLFRRLSSAVKSKVKPKDKILGGSERTRPKKKKKALRRNAKRQALGRPTRNYRF